MQGKRRDFVSRLWEKIAVGGLDECWPWTASLSSTGYGQINKGGKPVRAHRAVCELTRGPSLLHALHSCDNRRCCNPLHLSWGTRSRNMQDARDRHRVGGKQKLTRQQVEEIKHSTARTTDLAWVYQISRWQVTNIREGRQWNNG